MPLSFVILAVIFIGCLSLSAAFSGSETAFFSLSKWQISKMEEDRRKNVRLVEKLLERSDDLLNGILLGNLIVSIAAASSATFLSHFLFPETRLLSEGTLYMVDILAITLLILLFGEITPKVYAVDHPENFSSRVAPYLNVWIIVIKPFIRILSILTRAAKRVFGTSTKTSRFTEEELFTTVSTAMDNGNVDTSMIQKIFNFGDTMVNEIMVPRTNMLCIEEGTPIDEVYRQVKEIEHSRIPIYQENLDSITGILYAKDLLGYAFDFQKTHAL